MNNSNSDSNTNSTNAPNKRKNMNTKISDCLKSANYSRIKTLKYPKLATPCMKPKPIIKNHSLR